MPWARLDDSLIDHPKFNELMMEPDGWATFGFWSAMLIWANKHTRKPGKTPGLLKRADVYVMDRANAGRYAGLLVKAGFWELHDDGWLIHDFADFLPSEKKLAAQRENASKGGKAKAAARAALATGQKSLATGQDELATGLPSSSHALGTGIGSSKELEVVDGSVTTSRDEISRLCKRLADRIEENGSVRPSVTRGWLDACRLMIDKDGRTEEQIAKAIDWCQSDEFWRANILSMPKLRQQYDRLRLAAKRVNGTPVATSDQRAMMAIQAGLDAQARDEARQRKELT